MHDVQLIALKLAVPTAASQQREDRVTAFLLHRILLYWSMYLWKMKVNQMVAHICSALSLKATEPYK